MALDTAEKEVTKTDTIYRNTEELRDRMEEDYDLYRLEKFKVDSKEGEWDSYTTNSARVLASFIIDRLCEAKRRIWIPLEKEKMRERKALAMTEKLAIGGISLADSYRLSIPEQVPIQHALSWDATVRGWTAVRVYLYEEDGAVAVDIEVWDPLHVYWISGVDRRGLMWACYKQYLSEDEINLHYPGHNCQPDSSGYYPKFNVWDREEEGVILGDEYISRERHGLDHIPVFIRPTGATRLVQSRHHSDTIKDVGESFAHNNRNIYDSENRLWSYMLTVAGQAAKMPLILEWDSGRGGLPPELESNPYTKGKVILLDIAKGQSMKDFMKPPDMATTLNMMQLIGTQLSAGGVPPVATGQLNQYLPAAAVNLLTHSASAVLKPAKRNVELQFEWLAKEISSQYKDGNFGEMHLEGVDRAGQEFDCEVSAKDIENVWKFKCELMPDMPVDEVQNMGMAVESVKNGMLSRQTALDKWHIVDDPDSELDKIFKEEAGQQFALKMRKFIKTLWDDGDKEGASMMIRTLAEAMPQQPKMPAPASSGVPGSVPPQARIQGAMTSLRQPDIEEQRLAGLGMVRGK